MQANVQSYCQAHLSFCIPNSIRAVLRRCTLTGEPITAQTKDNHLEVKCGNTYVKTVKCRGYHIHLHFGCSGCISHLAPSDLHWDALLSLRSQQQQRLKTTT